MPPHYPSELFWLMNQQGSDGSISSGIPFDGHSVKVYETSLAILALVAANKLGFTGPTSNPTALYNCVENATRFLLNAQCVHPTVPYLPVEHGASNGQLTEDEYEYYYTYPFNSLPGDDPWWGGWGYPSTNRSDLSNTVWAVQALEAVSLWNNLGKLSGTIQTLLAPKALVWQNAANFTLHCWNHWDDFGGNPYHYGYDQGFGYQPHCVSYASMTGAGIRVAVALAEKGVVITL
jgi:hypothetical protein